MKVLSVPHLDQLGKGESGINTVIRAYFKHGAEHGLDFVDKDEDDFDLLSVHAGMIDNYPHQAPTVAHLHGLYWTADYHMPSWAHHANQRVVNSLRNADRITVPSSWVAEVFQRDMHTTPDILPHGIDWQDWQHDEPDEGFVLGYAKNRSGVDVCDPSFLGDLALRFPRLRFVSTFANHSPPNLKVTGQLPHAEMKRMIQRSSVYINATKETWGITMLEAMASGVPVLAFNIGGAKELVVHGVTGYLARPGNYDDLAQGLAYCLNHRKQLGANACEHAKTFTWDKAVSRLASIYKLTLEKPSPPTVGVVIPVYNKPVEQVKRAVESVLKQTRECSVVVVDDGSDDISYLEHIQSLDGVRVIEQSNKGVAHARNRGITELGDVKYICCLDSDDWLDSTFIEVCVEELERNKSVGVTYTGLTYHKPDGETGVSPWPSGFDYDKQLKKQNQVPTCCVYRKEIWEKLGGYRQRYAPLGAGSEDAEFFTRIGSIGYYGRQVTKEGLFHYSWMSGQVSGDPNYKEVDWLAWHPWVKDKQYPFASVVTPANNLSHLVRQYDEPSVSVVIPVGPGHEQLLVNALDSLEAQTFRHWEAVVVWDSDESHQSYVKSHPFIRWQFTDGAGIGTGFARNLGVDHSRGDYLVFLDADDWLHPECLEKMVNTWGMEGKGVYTDYVGISVVHDARQLAPNLQSSIISHNEKTNETVIGYEAAPFSPKKALRQPEATPYIWNNVTTLIPKHWHYEIGGFDENMVSWEDVDYWWRMAWAGRGFVRIPEQLMAYRFSTGARRDQGLAVRQELLDYLRRKRSNHHG